MDVTKEHVFRTYKMMIEEKNVLKKQYLQTKDEFTMFLINKKIKEINYLKYFYNNTYKEHLSLSKQ